MPVSAHSRSTTPVPGTGREAVAMRGGQQPTDPTAALLALVDLLAEAAAEEHYRKETSTPSSGENSSE